MTMTTTVKYPEGTPEYAAYRAALKVELAKWVAGDAPYYPFPLAEQARAEQAEHYRLLGVTR